MSRKNSEKEIEEAQKKFRGESKKEGKKEEKNLSSDEKKETTDKDTKILEKKEIKSFEEALLAESELVLKRPRETIDLETITKKEPALPAELHDSQYVEQLSHKPVGELYNEVKQLYQIAEDKGYLSPTEQRQVEYLSSAVQRKFEDEEQGIYSFSEQAARAASITQQLSASMIGAYKGRKNDMYRS